MLDSTSIQLTPADMMSFKKVLYGELATTSAVGDDYGAGFLPVGPGVLGLYAGAIPTTGAVTLLGMADDATLDSTTLPSGFGSVPSMNVPQNGLLGSNAVFGRVRALYGLEMAGGLRLAGGVSLYTRTVQDDTFKSRDSLPLPADYGTTNLKDSSSVIGIHAGANIPLGFINPLAIGVDVGLPSFEALQTYPDKKTDSYASDSGMDLAVRAKARLPNLIGSDMDTMAYVSFGTGTMEATSSSRTALPLGLFNTFKDGEKTIEAGHITVGASNNHRLGEGTVAFYSLTFENTTSSVNVVDTVVPTVTTVKTETSRNDVPIVLGFETRLSKWFVFRFSSKSSLMTVTTTDYTLTGGPTGASNADQTITDTNSSQTFSMGMTIDVSERLSIEGVLSEALLFNGPNFVGGGAPGLFGQVSVVARI